MKIAITILVAALGAMATPASAGHYRIFDPDFKFDCPPDQSSACETAPLRTGKDCQVDLLTNGESSVAARLASLRIKDIKTIRIQALIFAGDECGQYIAKRLIDLKRAYPNTKIQVIVDALSNVFPGGDAATAVKLSTATQEMYNYLESNGIELKGDPRQLTDDAVNSKNIAVLNKRFHDKMWIINGDDPVNGIAITGGMNIACDYFRQGPGAKHVWRDQDTIQRGRIVQDITAKFDDNFAYFGELERTRPSCFYTPGVMGKWFKWVDFWHHNVVERISKENDILKNMFKIDADGYKLDSGYEESSCRFVQSRPRFKEKYIVAAYKDLIENSDKEIRIANAYFIPPPEVVEMLKDAARHGKKIKILTNSYETNDLNQMTYASRALYKELMDVNEEPETKRNRGGLRIFEWQGKKKDQPQTDGTIHAKYMVSDRAASIIGSYNLDPRSQNLNSETVLVSKNPTKAGKLADQFDREDLSRALEITPQQAEKWNDPQKLKDGINLELSEKFKGQF